MTRKSQNLGILRPAFLWNDRAGFKNKKSQCKQNNEFAYIVIFTI
jgi:hypothetical protein